MDMRSCIIGALIIAPIWHWWVGDPISLLPLRIAASIGITATIVWIVNWLRA